MERDVIRQRLAEIPVAGLIMQTDEKWEFSDGDAFIEVSRHNLSIDGAEDWGIFFMSVTGNPWERARVIQEFSEVLGSPVKQDRVVGPGYNQETDILLWAAT